MMVQRRLLQITLFITIHQKNNLMHYRNSFVLVAESFCLPFIIEISFTMANLFNLSGKVALVTDASFGLGADAAKAYA